GYPLWQRADGRCGGDRAPGPAGPLDRHQHDRTLPRRFVVLPASSSGSRPRFHAGRPRRGHPRRYLPQPPEHGRPRRTLHADLQYRQHRATAGRARDRAGHPRHRQRPGDLRFVPRLPVADCAQHLRRPEKCSGLAQRSRRRHRHDAATGAVESRIAQRRADHCRRRARGAGDQRRHRAAGLPDRRQQPWQPDLPRHRPEQSAATAARRRVHRAAGVVARWRGHPCQPPLAGTRSAPVL
ncbi:L-proline glycine betaine ABC transport system permease protein ProW (TC 3.A.1.12.1), partial [Pseudomonas fluorescens]